jgi:hypothetical protein
MKWEQVRRGVAPAFAVGAMLMSGCTTYVNTQVTAFSNWHGSDATRTYAYTRTAEQRNSIEQSTYEQLVSDALERYAFKRVAPADARYLVGLTYGIQGETVAVSQPVFYGSPWGGPLWRPMDPWGPFGPFPAGYVTQTYPVFTHTLGVRITERATGAEVYNVTARNTDDEPSLVRAMPYLVRSALADFPLDNGAVRTVRIPVGKGGASVPANEVPAAPAGAGHTAKPASEPAPQ